MNKQRRKKIALAIKKIDEVCGELSEISSDEMEYADSMPENMHGSEKHSDAEIMSEEIEMVADEIAGLRDRLEELV